MATERRCTKCWEVKSFSEFHKQVKGKYGVVTQCKTCRAIKDKEYYEANRDKYLARSRIQYHAHREEALAAGRQWCIDNPEKVAAKARRWQVKNADHVASYMRMWRARTAGVVIEIIDIAEVWDYWGPMCAYCGSTEDLTLDHIVPLSQGGPHSFDNLTVACRSCNTSKSAKKLIEWMWWKARRAELEMTTNI